MNRWCPGCVECEVDGIPLDPILLAARQAMDAESRSAVDRLLGQRRRIGGFPGRGAVVVPTQAMTPRQRGAARRAALDAASAAEVTGLDAQGLQTGFGDRRRSGRRGRGIYFGMVKKPQGTRE